MGKGPKLFLQTLENMVRVQPSVSLPSFGQGPLSTPLLRMRKIKSTNTATLYSLQNQANPLHDLPPLALPGLITRVSRNATVGASLDLISEPFTPRHSQADDLLAIEGGYTAPLLLSAAAALLSALQFGYHIGNMNTASGAVRQHLGISSDFGANADTAWGFCVSIFCLGALFGCSLGAGIADTAGRRFAILLMSSCSAIGGILEMASAVPVCTHPPCVFGWAFVLMLTGRTMCGIASGAATVIVPMYLGEIAPPQVRGALGTCFQLLACVGILLAQILGLPAYLGTDLLWPLYFGLSIVPTVAQALLQPFFIESPRWLSSRLDPIKAEGAQIALARLRADDPSSLFVIQELDAIQMEAAAHSTNSSGYGRDRPILLDRRMRHGIIICVVCAVAQQLSGINNAFNYSTDFLGRAGISAAAISQITVLMNIGNVLVTMLSVLLMDLMGRKVLLLGSSVAMTMAILGLTAALSAPVDTDWVRTLALVSMVAFVFAFGAGLGPIPWLLPAELFPPEKCAQGSAIAATCNWLANFFVSQAFVSISMALEGYCFLPFAVLLIGFVYFIVRFLPETRGKTLEQIMCELNGSKKVTDPRFVSQVY